MAMMVELYVICSFEIPNITVSGKGVERTAREHTAQFCFTQYINEEQYFPEDNRQRWQKSQVQHKLIMIDSKMFSMETAETGAVRYHPMITYRSSSGRFPAENVYINHALLCVGPSVPEFRVLDIALENEYSLSYLSWWF